MCAKLEINYIHLVGSWETWGSRACINLILVLSSIFQKSRAVVDVDFEAVDNGFKGCVGASELLTRWLTNSIARVLSVHLHFQHRLVCDGDHATKHLGFCYERNISERNANGVLSFHRVHFSFERGNSYFEKQKRKCWMDQDCLLLDVATTCASKPGNAQRP